jgi:hypothetical protein
MQYMTPNAHEKAEWARLAQAAYSRDRNDIGHRFSGAASLRNAEAITLSLFDELQGIYRDWLVFDNFPEAL